jgi:hypothetical protein
MEKFVRGANIAHYKKLLQTEIDPVKRATLQKLLVEEQAKADGAGDLT